MVKIQVKSIWQGKIALRDKYFKEAEANGEGITIEYNGERMTLSTKEIRTRMTGVSERPVFDKFSNSKHYLCYYDWRPNVKQTILL